MAQAEVEHQRAVDTIVVLDVPAELRHRIADRRIADALRERGWHAGGKCVEAGERERAVFVAPLVSAIAGAVDREPCGHLVCAAERELQLVFDGELARPDAAVDLRAAGGEGVEHPDRRLIAHGLGIARPPSELHAKVVHIPLANRRAIAGPQPAIPLVP